MDEKFDDGVEKRGKTWHCSEIKSLRDFISTHDRSTLLVGSCVIFAGILEVVPIGALPLFGVRVVFRFSKIEKIFGVRMVEQKVI